MFWAESKRANLDSESLIQKQNFMMQNERQAMSRLERTNVQKRCLSHLSQILACEIALCPRFQLLRFWRSQRPGNKNITTLQDAAAAVHPYGVQFSLSHVYHESLLVNMTSVRDNHVGSEISAQLSLHKIMTGILIQIVAKT